MKILLFILVAIGLAIFPATGGAETKTYTFVEAPKPEPTGCPYGDSIPLDSEKCVAPKTLSAEQVINTKGEK